MSVFHPSRGSRRPPRSGRQAVGTRGMTPGWARRIDATAGRRAGGDDPRGRLVAQAVVGHEADAERAVAEEPGVAAKAVAQRRQIGKRASPSRSALRSPRSSASARTSRSFSRSVSTDRAGRAGPGPAAPGQGRRGGRQVEVDVGLGRGGLEGQDEERQELERHVEHRRHREEDLVGRTRAGTAGTGARRRPRPSRTSCPASGAVEAGIPMPTLMAVSLRRTTRLNWAKPRSWASARVRRTVPYDASRSARRMTTVGSSSPRPAEPSRRAARRQQAPARRGGPWPARPTRPTPPLPSAPGRRPAGRPAVERHRQAVEWSGPSRAGPPAPPAAAPRDWPLRAGCRNGPAS